MNSPATNAKRSPDGPAVISAAVSAAHEALIRDAFDDIALLVGSIAAIHSLDDDILWSLMKRLDRIRVRLLRNLQGGASRESFEPEAMRPPRTHAAVDEFLVRNRGRMRSTAWSANWRMCWRLRTPEARIRLQISKACSTPRVRC